MFWDIVGAGVWFLVWSGIHRFLDEERIFVGGDCLIEAFSVQRTVEGIDDILKDLISMIEILNRVDVMDVPSAIDLIVITPFIIIRIAIGIFVQ